MSERMLLSVARTKIKNSPSFNALHAASLRHVRALFKYSERDSECLREWAAKPELLLSAHAGVMNRKSARAVTLHRLAFQVIEESGIPIAPPRYFRGTSLNPELIRDDVFDSVSDIPGDYCERQGEWYPVIVAGEPKQVRLDFNNLQEIK